MLTKTTLIPDPTKTQRTFTAVEVLQAMVDAREKSMQEIDNKLGHKSEESRAFFGLMASAIVGLTLASLKEELGLDTPNGAYVERLDKEMKI